MASLGRSVKEDVLITRVHQFGSCVRSVGYVFKLFVALYSEGKGIGVFLLLCRTEANCRRASAKPFCSLLVLISLLQLPVFRGEASLIGR